MYDYIIVGGGAAGLVLAARLSEDPGAKVLVLEAGTENIYEASEYSTGAHVMWGPATNWSFMSAPQPELDGRQIMQPRGKLIGGSAAINVGSWSRGTRANYESWGLPGWDWEAVLAAYKKIECSRREDSDWRGQNGAMQLEDTPVGTPLTEVFRQAAIEVGVGVTTDRNAAEPVGFDIWETIFKDGRRFNTEHGYLNPARRRSNLTIETEAYVTRINIDGHRARSVSYSRGGHGQEAEAAREIILCAGAINSPQILMLSGIGPGEELRRHGIEVIENLPGVGGNLADHLRTDIGALTPEGIGETLFPDEDDPAQMARWRAGSYGPLTVTENTASAFVRSTPDVPHPDIEFMYSINPPMNLRQDNPGRAGWYINTGLVQPKSRGRVSLASADPMEKAIYDPAYLSDADDMSVYVRGVRTALAHAGTSALAPYTDPATLTLPIDADDAAIEARIRAVAESIYHPAGSAKMGIEGDSEAVLDPACRVRGIEGLRVADASSMPSLISGHTMAPAILVAEMVAGFIKAG